MRTVERFTTNERSEPTHVAKSRLCLTLGCAESRRISLQKPTPDELNHEGTGADLDQEPAKGYS